MEGARGRGRSVGKRCARDDIACYPEWAIFKDHVEGLDGKQPSIPLIYRGR